MWGKPFPKGVLSSPKPIKAGQHLSVDTEFKKGSTPPNKMGIGSVTIRIDKNGRSRRWIKMDQPNVWIPYATFVWVKNKGGMPKGFLPHHLDRNTLNDEITNLSLENRSSHINHHRSDLLATKVGLKLPLKEVMCPNCKEMIWGTKIGTLCLPCRKERRLNVKRAYKQRVHDRVRSE